MSNYFKEASHVIQQNYGGYCNKVRQAGVTPVSYMTFAQCFHSLHKSQWAEATKEFYKNHNL